MRFAFIPFDLFWSLLTISLDVFVIWVVAAHAATWRRLQVNGVSRRETRLPARSLGE